MLESYKIKLLLSFVSFLLIILTHTLLHKISKKSKTISDIKDKRRKIFSKLIKLGLTILYVLLLIVIWKINKQDLFIYVSSFLGILGVGFFAQWSLLSNITSGIILYLNHPITIGDYIYILDKDNPIEGTITDTGLFFMHIKGQNNEKYSIGNAIILQKTFRYVEKE